MNVLNAIFLATGSLAMIGLFAFLIFFIIIEIRDRW